MIAPWLLMAAALLAQADDGASPTAEGPKVSIGSVDDRRFPAITLDFELKSPDGEAILDAARGEFDVTEDGQPVEVLDFHSPISREFRPTTVVLVVDHSGSMQQEGRMGSLRRAVAAFLEQQPPGSRLAVVAFSGEVEKACDFTDDYAEVQAAVDELAPGGPTRFYDAVRRAVVMLANQEGRRAVVAMTDGMDTASQAADLASVAKLAKEAGLPVHTVGVGSEEQIAADELRFLAENTRGRYFAAPDAAQLRAIYEEIARSLKESYSLTYRTNRPLQDGTLRPVEVSYRANPKGSAVASVYVPGMVVPAGGWSALYVALLAGLAALAVLPGALRRRRAVSGARP
jgi:VWFA-related protein